VVCSGAIRAVLQQLAPAFETSSGDKLVIEYATAGKVEQKVAAFALFRRPPVKARRGSARSSRR